MTQRVFGIIPARMAASRFPGKPLVEKICGKSMIRHVAETALSFPTELASGQQPVTMKLLNI